MQRSKRSYYSSKNRRNTTNTRNNNRRGKQYIDPARFVKAAQPRQSVEHKARHTFSDFALHPLLAKNLQAKGYHTPSPIQDEAIPVGLTGQDIIGIASTGTGKTAAFAIPILQALLQEPKSCALVIAPTRELAQQIEAECRALTEGSRIKTAVIIGGSSFGRQLQALRSNPQLIIGTPGRLKDHLERRTLNLSRCNFVVLDEVDRMLDMGFVHDVTTILEQASTTRQSFFFSATIDPRVRTLIDNFTTEPFKIAIKADAASENVHQDVVRYASSSQKMDLLHDVLITNEVQKVIVFDETKRNVDRLSKELVSRGFVAESIHGGKSQGQRQRALAKFKRSEVQILVATDVAARGIDVKDISHVINYSVPAAYDDYIHRIGRAGRAGRIGYALTFVEHTERQLTPSRSY